MSLLNKHLNSHNFPVSVAELLASDGFRFYHKIFSEEHYKFIHPDAPFAVYLIYKPNNPSRKFVMHASHTNEHFEYDLDEDFECKHLSEVREQMSAWKETIGLL